MRWLCSPYCAAEVVGSLGSIWGLGRSSRLLQVMRLLALPQRLVESLAERQIRLALGALEELLDLPGAGSLRLCLLWLLGVVLLLLGGRSRGGGCRSSCLLVAGSAEQRGDSRAHGVSDSRSDGHATSGGGHLLEHWRLLGRRHAHGARGGRDGCRWRRRGSSTCWHRCGSWGRCATVIGEECCYYNLFVCVKGTILLNFVPL